MKIRIVLLCLLLAATAAAETPRWGLGWAGAPTLRHRLTDDWEVELQAAPNDYRNESSTLLWDEDDPEEIQGFLSNQEDDRREQGWVRLGMGRRLLTDGALSLVATASLRYRWSHEQDWYHTISEPGVDEHWTRNKTDWEEWNTALGFRIQVMLEERVQLQTGFGVLFSSEDRTIADRTIRLQGDNVTEQETFRDNHYSSFSSFGWSGFSSLGVLVWF